jgi:putative hydrolase of the HAD superfamily
MLSPAGESIHDTMGGRAGLKGVLVDLWGTLVPVSSQSSRAPHLRAIAEALDVDPVSFERDWAASMPERCIGALGPLEETLRRVALRQGRNPPPEAVRRALDIRLDYSRAALEGSGPVIPALDALRDAGLRLAVVSDTTAETSRLWPNIALGSRFQATVFSCDTGFCKPDPRAYRSAWEQLGLEPGDCVYVGDGDSRELTGARSVGLKAFLYRSPSQAIEPEYRMAPDTEWRGRTLNDLREILRM